MRFRGILRVAAAAVAVATAAFAAPAAAGAATVRITVPVGAATRPGVLPPVHVTKVNLHAQLIRQRGHVPVGREAGIVPPLGVAKAARMPSTMARTPSAAMRRGNPASCAEPNCNMLWNGGPVQHTPKVYLLFWGPNWQSDPGQDASLTYLENLFSGLGTSSDTWSTIMTQYTDGSGHPVFGTSELVAAAQDTSSPPSTVTPSTLGNEAAAGATFWGLSDLGNDQVIVISQPGTCFSDGFAGSSCQPVPPRYCAWHSDVAYNASALSFTNLPYQIDAGGSCGLGFVNSPGTYDGFSIVGGHEYAETVTDPYPSSGYWDPNDNISGGEIGDKCAWGGQLWGTPDPIGDITLSTGTFAMQSLWDNSSVSCQISFTVSPTPTSVSTSLSGGSQSGGTITVPAGTAVTDSATLTGANAGSASGTVDYRIYSDTACTQLVSGGSDKTISTPGVMPASDPAVLAPGTYYWQASYSGDPSNQPSASTCGPSGEVETVTKTATSVSTVLSGDGVTGASITIPSGATARDAATLSGANAASATGAVTYRVYSNATCTTQAAGPMTVAVFGGVVPKSPSLLLTKVGTYYWRAFYSGDSVNNAAASNCGGEILRVRAVPVFDTMAHGVAKTSVTVKLSTTAAGGLIVAYVAGRGPARSAQTAIVSGAGLAWHLVGRSNSGRGDAEVWWARATGKLSLAKITAKEHFTGWPVALTVVSYKSAVGIGGHATAHSSAGAPTGSLATTWAGSWVWAAGDDWARGIARTPVAGQAVVTEQTDSTDTYWVQTTRKVTLPAGTTVTIKDTAPTADPYNLVLVEIR